MDFIKDDKYLEILKNKKIFKNKNLQKQIYKLLLDLIIKGHLQSNTLLLENKISLALNVSKTPVREALKRLEIDELIKIIPQSKTYVLPINLKKINSSYKIREALELLLVTEAVLNLRKEDCIIFDTLIYKQEKALQKNDYGAFFEYDEAFHLQIAKSANLIDAWNLLQKASLHINRIRCMTKNDDSWNNSVITEHKNILNAIKNTDVELARYQMSIHLSKVTQIMSRNLNKKVYHDTKQ